MDRLANRTAYLLPPKERHRRAYATMLVSSLISLVASFVLSWDAVKLASDPYTDLGCNLSEKISCATVGLAWQSSVLGFPNAFLGLIAEPVVITIAVAGLGGVVFPRWFTTAAQGIYAIGLAFALWLFAQAYFVIGALCPWCLLVTVSTVTVFMSLLHVNIADNAFGLPKRMHTRLAYAMRLGADTAITVLTVAIIVAMVLLRYW